MYTFLIIQDARRFFTTELMMEDFDDDAIVDVVFPTSRLDLTALKLALLEDPTVTNFPPKWNIGRGNEGGNGCDHGGNNGRFDQGWGVPAPPTGTNPFAGPPQQWQQPPLQQSVQDSVAHVHPTIHGKLKAFHNQFEGRINMTTILQAGNSSLNDLPYHPFAQEQLCWQHTLGHCRHQNECYFDHCPASEIGDQFANEVCRIIEPGIGMLLANPPQYGYLVGRRFRKRRR